MRSATAPPASSLLPDVPSFAEGPLAAERPDSVAEIKLICAGKFMDNNVVLGSEWAPPLCWRAAHSGQTGRAPRPPHIRPLPSACMLAWCCHRQLAAQNHTLGAQQNAAPQLSSEALGAGDMLRCLSVTCAQAGPGLVQTIVLCHPPPLNEQACSMYWGSRGPTSS